MGGRAHRVLRWFAGAAGALVLLLGGYALAGIAGGALPANAGWRPPERGVRIVVESNGFHTGLVLPKRAAGEDLSDLASAQGLRDPRFAGFDHIAIGWGDRDFYEHTPTIADVKAGTIARAMTGLGSTVLHVEHVPARRAGPMDRPLLLRPEEYHRLVAFIRAHAVPGSARRPGLVHNDNFQDAKGHYSALYTCNSWTGRALRVAGVRVGMWTPFPQTVMWWFR